MFLECKGEDRGTVPSKVCMGECRSSWAMKNAGFMTDGEDVPREAVHGKASGICGM